MGKRRPKAPQCADTRGGRWVGIPYVVVESDAYRDLSLWARAILTQIIYKFDGSNNGKIGTGFTELAERLNNRNRTKISKAIAELVEHGFLDVSIEGSWEQRRAREYRLTFVNTTPGGGHLAATNEYRSWAPSGHKAEPAKRKSGGSTVEPVKAPSGHRVKPVAESAGHKAEPAKIPELRDSAVFKAGGPSPTGFTVEPHIRYHTPPVEKLGDDEDQSPSSSQPASSSKNGRSAKLDETIDAPQLRARLIRTAGPPPQPGRPPNNPIIAELATKAKIEPGLITGFWQGEGMDAPDLARLLAALTPRQPKRRLRHGH